MFQDSNETFANRREDGAEVAASSNGTPAGAMLSCWRVLSEDVVRAYRVPAEAIEAVARTGGHRS
jgi:hypothetical protein